MMRYCFLLVLLVGLAVGGSASAAIFTVTVTEDTNDGICDIHCSLREAIDGANTLATNDTIEFSAAQFSTAQTIVLSGSELIIANNGTLVINGTGTNRLTIDGNNASRIFLNGAEAQTTINNMSLTRGNGAGSVNTGRGGAVYNYGGVLTLDGVNMFANTANNGGALNTANSGQTTIILCYVYGNSTVSSSGGGLQNFSSSILNVIDSTFEDNTTVVTSSGGGAMQLNGTATLTNVTLSNNKAPTASGGGIYFNGTSLTLTNVTITGNSSLNNAGGLHSTRVADNSMITNTLIVANTSVNSPSIDASGTFTSGGNNLIGFVGTSTGWIGSDILNPASPNLQLNALANNGGPTPTHAPTEDSLARDNGNNSSCSELDQRGARRPDGLCDIGAVEGDPPFGGCYIVPTKNASLVTFCL